MNIPEMPILTSRIDPMKHSIHNAMMLHVDEISKYVQFRVDQLCSEDSLHEVINREAKRVIEETIKQELESFYRFGPGSEVIKNAIVEKLSDNI